MKGVPESRMKERFEIQVGNEAKWRKISTKWVKSGCKCPVKLVQAKEISI